jgi:hypothetical protein
MPLLILAGSDRRPGPVPVELTADDMLSGFKGALPLPWGPCLAAELAARYRASERFADPLLIGPRSVYEGLVDCEIVDVEGSFLNTLECVVRLIGERFPPGTPVAVSSCDILPTAGEIRELLETSYDPVAECNFWWQFIAAEPDEMGASGWKPRYAIRPHADEAPWTMYPGHLAILRPSSIRFALLIRLLTLAYRYRNRPLRKRVLPMLVRGVGMLIAQDVRNLAAGQLPILTGSIPWHVLRAYQEFRKRKLSIESFERHLSRIVLHRAYRRTPRPIVAAVSRIVSFAQDIDSRAELQAVERAHEG